VKTIICVGLTAAVILLLLPVLSGCDSEPVSSSNGSVATDGSRATAPVTTTETTAETTVETTTEPPAPSHDIDNEWALWLINPRNPLPPDYEPPALEFVGYHFDGARRYLDSRAAPYAVALMEAASADGISLTPISTYRNVSLQRTNFRNLFQRQIDSGYSPEAAFDYAASWIAPPGTSEHNAGVAVDFNSTSLAFDQTAEFRWLRDNAHRFGFILRYPENTEHITGIRYEPWHFRFVGEYHAGQIWEQGVTLEEYISECAEDDSVVEAFRAELVG
jgi:D-alanyl-D-alanine carboxypeptidase